MFLLHHVLIQSWSPSVTIDLAFWKEILLVSLYLGPLRNNFLNLLFPMLHKSTVTIRLWSLSIKPHLAQLPGKMLLFRRKPLTSRLEEKIKIKYSDPIRFVIRCITAESSNLISLVKHAFTNGSWKKWLILMSSTPLFRKETLQILVGAFLLPLGCRWFEYLRVSDNQSQGIPLKPYRICFVIQKENCCIFKIAFIHC